MPDFEPRAGQVEMAVAVARVFEEGGVLLAEAGTGTGKTLAYLVPAILSRERVLISTGTKNLQEQIFFKDIPALRDALDVPFTATYMKGRANYLCLHRLDQLSEGAGPAMHDVFLPIIREWSTRTETGDRAELEDLPEDVAFWSEVSATAETCLGTECPRYDDCFVTRMRQRAAASDVVIVNHHLLCADAAVRQNAFGEVIPACSRAILDEAHQLEDVATQYFGYSISTYRLEELAHDVERLVAVGGFEDANVRAEIERAVERLRDHAKSFFTELAFAHRGEDSGKGRGPVRFKNDERMRASVESLGQTREAAAHLTGALDVLQATLALVRLKPDPTNEENAGDGDEQREALARRAGEIRDDLRFMLRAGDDQYVYFVEFRGRALRHAQGAPSLSRGGIFLRASPIDVSAIVREVLFDRMRTTVLTSATLAVDGTFEYIRARLGIRGAAEVRLPSEFDFARQALLYLPPRMPDPRSDAFALAAGREVIEILKRTRGRAFVLFTSYATMRAVQALAEMAVDYPIFAQGAAPRSQLLNQFRATPHSVLFATSSFWQGVDVVGEALSCVIVDKLPFASPGDPVTAARIEAIRARGGDPFAEYQVPLAILALQQGLGRLIRHRRDRGVLAVLDPRLRTKGYGRRFVASLPPAPVVHDLSHIAAFFSD
ncbi:MAG: ATP-dependent DNA helicase [Acidobacteria bacterium]|nr:ATP-dependent DNA helicase [Acidobacteriota bacterium]